MARFQLHPVRASGKAWWACLVLAYVGVLELCCRAAFAQTGAPTVQGPPQHFSGMAEASAAALLDDRHLVVAEDECNVLRVYRIGEAAPVGPPIDLRTFLGTGEKASDIEGAARMGGVVYWISSHSRTKDGKVRDWRRRLFATQVVPGSAGQPPSVASIGVPYQRLLADMQSAPSLKSLKLDEAAAKKPEETGGLNIEGLAAGEDGSLWVGFRNPLREGKAILVPLMNPAAVVQGSAASFGKPILLALGGRGIRAITRGGDHYWIVAGPVADAGTFALYRWSGKAADAPQPRGLVPKDFQAEAAVATGANSLMLLSDDGSTQPEAACGSSSKATQKFRALRYQLP